MPVDEKMGERLLQFIQQLRAASIRISVAETLDAANAVAAAGLERVRMREALAASLIKDEADRPLFGRLFDSHFGSYHAGRGQPRLGRSQERLSGRGGRLGEGASLRPEPRVEDAPGGAQRRDDREQEGELAARAADANDDARNENGRSSAEVGAELGAEPRADGAEAGRLARARALENKRFVDYSQLDYQRARAALEPLSRRFRARLGRRLRIGRRGRLDFRRTIRAATQRGGSLLELRLRARRPRHVDLLLLADVSGSVRHSAELILELAAGAREFFRRVRSFVFVERLAEADFERGHVVMAPVLDLYARSDFGRVLAELWTSYRGLLGRATLLVILGDGRNNRRPPRTDLLRALARRCRAVVWLNPEPRERWGTGDSAIEAYARELTALLPCANLRELEAALKHVA